MARSFAYKGASQYIQGEFCLSKIGEEASKIGKKAFVLGGKTSLLVAGDRVQSSLSTAGIPYEVSEFSGFCSPERIDVYSEHFRKSGADLVIGMGGGRAIDTAKGVALRTGAPFLLAPTSVAQCACCANVIILYEENGDPMPKAWNLDHSAAAVMVDTDIIVRHCPVRMFATGIADSMAKLPEIEFLRANTSDWREVFLTAYSYQMAENIYQLYLEKAAAAVEDVKAKRLTPVVEDVITANVLLTGLSSALASGTRQIALPHNIYYAICQHYKPQQAKYMHGEMVSLGLAVQFLVNGAAQAKVRECVDLLRIIGVPVVPEDVGLEASGELVETLLDYCVSQMPYMDTSCVKTAKAAMEQLWLVG